MDAKATHYRRWGKRIFDVLVSAAALILLAPLLAFIALVVRWRLGGPVLFRQVRTGQGRQPFTILKFRTMTNTRDVDGDLLSDSQRLTRLGNLLRATSLDELPELWNVLKGEMSLIGPRPLLPHYDMYYTERENLRFSVPPGITGWAQINGRNELAWDGRLECDAWYAESYSFALDLRILFVTVFKVLRRDNVQVNPALTVGALDEERRQRANKEPRRKGMNHLAHRNDGDVSERSETVHVNFRVLTPEDANAVSRLLQESPPDYMRFFHPFPFDALAVRQQLERGKKDVFFGLEVTSASARALAGFYMLRGLDEGYPNPMYGVFVSLPFRGKGLARLTLVHAVSFCKLNHYEKILLKVDPHNVHAKELYESCGFSFLREEPGSRDVVLCREVNSVCFQAG